MNKKLIAIANLSFLDIKEKIFLWKQEEIGDIEELNLLEICEFIGRRPKKAEIGENATKLWKNQNAMQFELGQAKRLELVPIWDENYPGLVRYSCTPPFLLWLKGRLPKGDSLSLSVVGTRKPSEACRKAAWDIGSTCAQYGVCVVSGLAFGIDGACHAGCTRFGGKSIAVLASGLDKVSPRAHAKLASEIIAMGGGLVSEYGPGTETANWRYLARNRIIATWSPGTMVVEAPLRSGALSTAQHALDEGREIMVHPNSLNSLSGFGTKKLVEEGAQVLGHVGGYIEQFARNYY